MQMPIKLKENYLKNNIFKELDKIKAHFRKIRKYLFIRYFKCTVNGKFKKNILIKMI
jgi:hypothetical protein